MEQIRLAYAFPCYCYKDAQQRTECNGDTDFFNIIAGVLQGDTLAQFLFQILFGYL